MPWPVSLGVLALIGAGLLWLGMRGFRKRVLG
jgi:hypothetical protein